MGYEVSTPVFAGPIDLLVTLINAQQVELWDVSIAEIVNGYLAAIEIAAIEAAAIEGAAIEGAAIEGAAIEGAAIEGAAIEGAAIEGAASLDLEVATEVAMVAATLIQLKCRRLLPGPDDVDLDEELSPWEDRDLLLTRMLECQTFARAARHLQDLGAQAVLSAPRVAGLEEGLLRLAPDLLAGVSPLDLRDAFLRVSTPRPVPRVDSSHLAPPLLSVEEVVTILARELEGLGRTTFRHLTRHARTRQDVVVVFLGLLELFKVGSVDLDQAETFGELRVAWLPSPTRGVLVGALERR
ncbi:MAG: segregation and condensation protein A [Acidimicrobiales bacterium]